MNEIIVASVVLLWVAVIGLGILVFALARQIGVLHTRIAPAGALMTSAGPKVGEAAPAMSLTALSGDTVEIGGTPGIAQLVLFVSPTCPVCKQLVPAAQSLARSERRRLKLVFASDGDLPEKHAAYAQRMDIVEPYVLSTELGLRYEVGKLPHALLIDQAGVLRSKGLVNSREHLESLVEAMDSGYESIQDYLYRDATLESEASS